MQLEKYAALVPERLMDRGGAVFYSGRAAFEGRSKLYILGLNPAGERDAAQNGTVRHDIEDAINNPEPAWSAYVDSAWTDPRPGRSLMQVRIRHLAKMINIDLRTTPSSNLVFVSSRHWDDLAGERTPLLDSCWGFHAHVIAEHDTRVVICLGTQAGLYARRRLNTMEDRIDQLKEDNERSWTHEAHRNGAGQYVLTLMHPSVSDWTTSACDPTPLVKRILDGDKLTGL